MLKISNKEMKVQFALGTLSPMKLFLEMLKTQNEDTIKSGDWPDNRTPKTTPREKDNESNIYVEVSDKIVFEFNSKEEFIGVYCYKG